MHILPIAGSASRFQGIPKYLLPVNAGAESLLHVHINAAMKIDSGKIVVMAHPTMFDFLSEYLSHFTSRVIVDRIVSRTMTETVLQGAIRHGQPGEIVSITLPDTITLSTDGNGLAGAIQNARKVPNSLILYPHLEGHRGKFGQVLTSNEDNEVLDIIDKDYECSYPYIWGGVSIEWEILIKFNPNEATIGNCIGDLITNGTRFRGVITQARYFDCGNMTDYLEYLDAMKLIP